MARNAAPARSLVLCLALVASLWLLPSTTLGQEGRQDAAPPPAVEPAPVPPPSLPGWADAAIGFDAALSSFAASWPGLEDLRGTARVEVRWGGSKDGAHRLVRLRSEDASLRGMPLGVLQVVAWTPAGSARSSVDLTLEGPLAETLHAELDAELTIDAATGRIELYDSPLRGTLTAVGLDLSQLGSAWPQAAAAGTLDVDLALGGTATAPQFYIRAQGRGLELNGEEVGELTVSWMHAVDESRLHLTWGPHRHPKLLGKLVLPLELDLSQRDARWLDDRPLTLEVTGTGLTETQLRPFWRPPAATGLKANLKIQGAGTLAALDLKASLVGELRNGDQPPLPFELVLGVGPTEQRFDARLGGQLIALQLKTQAALVALRKGQRQAESVALSGSLSLGLPMEAVTPYLPDALYDTRGLLEGSLRLGGTLGQPSTNGRLALTGGATTVLDLNERLRDVQVEATLAGSQLTWSRMEARVGAGHLRGDGSMRWVVTPPGHAGSLWESWTLHGDAGLVFQDLPFAQEGLPLGTAGGKLSLAFEAHPGDTDVEVKVDGGHIQLGEKELDRPADPPSHRGVRLLDWLGQVSGEQSLLAGEGHLRLRMAVEQGLSIRGPGVELDLDGAIELDRQDTIATVDGGIRAAEGGRFQLFENDFRVRGGTLTLVGGRVGALANLDAAAAPGKLAVLRDPDRPLQARPLEPVVDLAAQGLVVDTQVLVRVRGPLRRPELVLASVPALPEYQIITLLVTGSVDAVDDRNGEVRRQVASLVHRFHNPGLARQLYDRLGVDKLGFGFGSSVSEPILTVGKQLNRQVYVETVYHHNAPPDENEKEGHVEYRLDRHWTLNTRFGDAAVGKLGVFWGTSFGAPPPPPADARFIEAARAPKPDRDGDGLIDRMDACAARPEDRDGFEDDDGCPDDDNDGDGVPDSADAAPDQPETFNGYRDDDGAPDSAPEPFARLTAQLRPIPFLPRATRTAPGARPTLQSLRQLLREFPALRLRVLPPGEAGLDRRRADALRRSLAAAGGLWRTELGDAPVEAASRAPKGTVAVEVTQEAVADGGSGAAR